MPKNFLEMLPQMKESVRCVISEVKAVNRCKTCILQPTLHGATQLNFLLRLIQDISEERDIFKTKIPDLSEKTDKHKIVL
jgi:hypothetical protein